MKLTLTPKQTRKFKRDIISTIKTCKTSSQLNCVIGMIYNAGETSSKTGKEKQ